MSVLRTRAGCRKATAATTREAGAGYGVESLGGAERVVRGQRVVERQVRTRPRARSCGFVVLVLDAHPKLVRSQDMHEAVLSPRKKREITVLRRDEREREALLLGAEAHGGLVPISSQ